MNDLLRQRILRRLETLPEERAYQILDYIEFLESKYAERSAPSGILAKITDTVEDTIRAAKLPVQAVSGAASVMDSASRLMRGLAAAGSAVVNEAVKAASSDPSPIAAPNSTPPTPPGPAPRTDS
ncbi:MAG TPA: DUF2281 domain-containing protein [Gemmatimonadales bacterium]|nr:DUF2281 domain-containing protein [Gemmatimonadales bacterium]